MIHESPDGGKTIKSREMNLPNHNSSNNSEAKLPNHMTSIEWLEQIAKSMVINGGDLGEDYPALMVHIQQAKEMHKTELGKTWDAALDKYEVRAGNYMRAYEDFDDYYEETFVSKGSDEVKEESLVEKMIPHQLKYNLDVMEKLTPIKLPQQEISDEEIEKWAKEYTCKEYEKLIFDYENYDTYNDFVNGAKKYREQLKNFKQTKKN